MGGAGREVPSIHTELRVFEHTSADLLPLHSDSTPIFPAAFDLSTLFEHKNVATE